MRYTNLIAAALLLLACTLFYFEAFAQPAVDNTTPAADTTAVAPEEEEDEEVDVVPADDDVAEGLSDVVNGVGQIGVAKNSKTGMFMAISMLIAGVLKIALSLLKLTGAAIFKNGTVLKIVLLTLGVCVFLVSRFAAGDAWYNALILAFAAPGAVLINEIVKLIPQLRDKKG